MATFDQVFGDGWAMLQNQHGTTTATYRSRAHPGDGVELVGVLGNVDQRDSDDGLRPSEKTRRRIDFEYSTADLTDPVTRARVTVGGLVWSVSGVRSGPVVTVLELERTTSVQDSRRRRR